MNWKFIVQFNDRHCYVQDTKPGAVRKVRDEQKPSPILKNYIVYNTLVRKRYIYKELHNFLFSIYWAPLCSKYSYKYWEYSNEKTEVSVIELNIPSEER